MPFKHNGSRGRLDALFLFPSALAFAESCGSMSLAEYGQVIVKAPEILRCKLEHKFVSQVGISFKYAQRTFRRSQTHDNLGEKIDTKLCRTIRLWCWLLHML